MKKVIAIMLSAILLLSLCACGQEIPVVEEEVTSQPTEIVTVEPTENVQTEAPKVTAQPKETKETVVQNKVEEPKVQKIMCADCGNQEVKKGSAYCDFCSCWYSDCPVKAVEGSSYCMSHKCLVCDRGQASSSVYCSTHKCNRCEGMVVGDSDYCVEHKCMLCDRQATSGKYCYFCSK